MFMYDSEIRLTGKDLQVPSSSNGWNIRLHCLVSHESMIGERCMDV